MALHCHFYVTSTVPDISASIIFLWFLTNNLTAKGAAWRRAKLLSSQLGDTRALLRIYKIKVF
jgi:hypothetical protein